MLGYIRAYKPELKVKDYEIYKGVYCSLCKRLGKRYSPLAQLFLSYDFTFLIILKISISSECPGFKSSRCHYNPLVKCKTCVSNNKDFDLCVDAAVIMSYYKVKDNIIDSGLKKRILATIILPFIFFMHKKAAHNSPEIEQIVSSAMHEQKLVEASEKCSIDNAADPTAKALSKILILNEKDKQRIVILERLGYMIGRWVYLIDAVDDLKDDLEKNNFNPLKEVYISLADRSQWESFTEYAQQLLNSTAGEAVLAFQLLETKHFRAILENILYDGLSKTADKILNINRRCDREKSI